MRRAFARHESAPVPISKTRNVVLWVLGIVCFGSLFALLVLSMSAPPLVLSQYLHGEWLVVPASAAPARGALMLPASIHLDLQPYLTPPDEVNDVASLPLAAPLVDVLGF